MHPEEQEQVGIQRGRRPRGEPMGEHEWLPYSAPFLSFLWPGLGQYQLGRWRWALLHAIPPLVLLLALLVTLVSGPEGFALRLFVPAFALGVIGLIAAHALWRVLSIIDAWWASRGTSPHSGRALPLVVVLSLAVIATHALAGFFVHDYSTAGRPIFSTTQPRATPPPAPVQGEPADEEPAPLDEDDDDVLGDIIGEELPTIDLGLGLDPGPGIPREGPLTVLFVGVDSGPGRDHALTDTLMVGAFDRHTSEMALINIPRDTGRFPVYNGTGTYNNRINSFLSHARRHPDRFPEGPVRALANQVAYLVGIPIHYYAVIDMAGFEKLIDMVGGVTVTIDYRIADPMRRLIMEPGTHRLDGKQALSFVRSRHGPNNNDYRRAQRQQQVIRAIADRLRDPSVAVRLPQITREAARVARTNIPVENLEEFLAVLDDTHDATPTRVVLQPRRYAQRVPPSEVGGRFMTELRMEQVEALSIELFGEFSLYSRRGEQQQLPTN